ncbi:crotonase/enoyl-CoA hydratase family protein [Mycobacterium ulcerans]|uniref:Enoyl-CoA hydratase n=2 Tax=Mycobacterium ulcerans TaxID=1809 RepID=A0A1B4Y8T7_MYCUL|nr:crotonase/enoyl-CoA hydratase family protein [Mycobacterium ulcerans]MEB3905590.1 crotonase/enoyl-CoA hydratase family protein [Mycobacterium ulcerans]MEB3909767.1 crotonase/enoyl-CoA hydratase family protein [Mycobacterium ulcerans]MEB3920030.1 crotonase/enoyl-CoA hydratase family protein [Mycobacterium ulcerans]MEB3924083.1 crotonase/enoyl-CoA hydratase family protein [Mycobacterium ulcerans]MEB3928294.1 crotonase/enoyl-CoA hydratase family protein [Mycobacterium ulcerans]
MQMTTTETSLPKLATVSLERDGHVLLIGLNRPQKRNSFDRAMFADLSRAYALLETDDSVRAGVLFAHGDHFTGGLDLVDVAPSIAAGQSPFPADGRDPWRLDGPWRTPLIAVAHGWCMTLGIELLLASDIRIAAAGTRFSQLEVQRGIYPFGGATIRLTRDAGWGNAMRWLLTGDEFDAAEAHRIGLVQEVADDAATALTRAREIAQTIADRAAPLGVRATLASVHLARREGEAAAIERLVPDIRALFTSADAAEGVQSFIERRQARFTGR